MFMISNFVLKCLIAWWSSRPIAIFFLVYDFDKIEADMIAYLLTKLQQRRIEKYLW